MPSRQVLHPSGNRIPNELRTQLIDYFHFDLHTLERLERLGGRIAVSIAAPYVAQRNQKKGKEARNPVEINQDFVASIKLPKGDPKELETRLKELTAKELRKLAELTGQPLRSDATTAEMRSELSRNLQAEEFWSRISNVDRSK